MDKYKITLVYAAGDFVQDTREVETEYTEMSLHHIVAEAFDLEDRSGSCATVVSRDVWQVTVAGGVFIAEKA